MTLQQAIKVLDTHNKWRKGAEIPQEKPHIIGMAIDIVVGHHKDEPITKQALLDRGFDPDWGDNEYEFILKTGQVYIIVNTRFNEVSAIKDMSLIRFPNCRTLKQLDNLIELFK